MIYPRQRSSHWANKWYTPLLVAWDSAYWGEKHLKISTPIIQIYVDGSVRSQSRVPHCMGEITDVCGAQVSLARLSSALSLSN